MAGYFIVGLGPITFKGREIILDKLLYAKQKSHHDLIEEQEVHRIHQLWSVDINNARYKAA